MKQLIKKAFLVGIGWLAFACSDENEEPYGPDYEITGIKLEVCDQEYYNDTIPADVFKMELTLMSDNDYALQYGLSPKLTSRITDLTVSLDNLEAVTSIEDSDVSDLFVVEDGWRHNYLYETIEQYTAKEQLVSLTPLLVFTNQSDLVPKPDKLITDTVAVEFSVKLMLANNKFYTSQVKTVLIP